MKHSRGISVDVKHEFSRTDDTYVTTIAQITQIVRRHVVYWVYCSQNLVEYIMYVCQYDKTNLRNLIGFDISFFNYICLCQLYWMSIPCTQYNPIKQSRFREKCWRLVDKIRVHIVWIYWMYISCDIHDDVIKWKHFRVTDPLRRQFTAHRWIPSTTFVTQSFDVFFDLRLNKQLSKQ